MRCLPIVLPSLYGSSPSRRPACRPTHPLRAPLTHLPRISHAGLPIANASSSLYLALLDDDGSSSLGSLDDDDPVGAHMAWAWCMEHGMVHGPCGQGMVHGLWHGAWVMWYGHGAWAWVWCMGNVAWAWCMGMVHVHRHWRGYACIVGRTRARTSRAAVCPGRLVVQPSSLRPNSIIDAWWPLTHKPCGREKAGERGSLRLRLCVTWEHEGVLLTQPARTLLHREGVIGGDGATRFTIKLSHRRARAAAE